jgi:hypothetical protein
VNGEPVDDSRHYTLGLTGYHADNCLKNLNLTSDELTHLGGIKVVATSVTSVLEEYLRSHPNLNRYIEGRLVFRAA